MPDAVEERYAEMAKRIVRTEMVRRGVTYEGLAERLATLGVHDTPVNLRNKVSRGKFTASFLLECLSVLECTTLDIQLKS